MNGWARLVRAPAALTTLGDTVAGASAAKRPLRGARVLLPLSSAALYWAGMALNDWADRHRDAVERPERPIPSGEVTPVQAMAAAVALTAAGLGLAAAGGGRDSLLVAVPLAGTVWAYDLVLASTPAAPAGMAACRGLDVLLGSGGAGAASAWVPAGAVAAHTLGVTVLSAGEVDGTSRRRAGAAAALTLSTAAALTADAIRRRSAMTAICGLGYAGLVGRAQLAAARGRSAHAVRQATAAGVHGMIPLQAALTARSGSPVPAGLLLAALAWVRRPGTGSPA